MTLRAALVEALHESLDPLLCRYDPVVDDHGNEVPSDDMPSLVLVERACDAEYHADHADAILAHPAMQRVAAVVEAADEWRKAWGERGGYLPESHDTPLIRAVDALRGEDR